jgi:transcriptional regulator with XRE-family HTH domain
MMAMMLTPRGDRIRHLREKRETEYRQKTIAGKSGISERRLRRIENENLITKAEGLRRLAAILETTLDDIAFAPDAGPHLATENGQRVVRPPASESQPEFIEIPRHGTTYLRPARGAQHLCDEAGYTPKKSCRTFWSNQTLNDSLSSKSCCRSSRE